MSDKAFHEADMEVIRMVNQRNSRSGQLPGKAIHYIPEERAEVVLDLDRRLDRLRNSIPALAAGTIIVFLLILII